MMTDGPALPERCQAGARLHIDLCPSRPSAEWLMQVGSLAMAVNSKSSFLRGSERSLRLAVGLLTKTFLQNLDRLQDRPQFPHLWNRILQVATRHAPCLHLSCHVTRR